VRGGNFDSWDFEARAGAFGAARMRMGVEEHGQGKQLVRFRVWPRVLRGGALLLVLTGLCCALAAYRGRIAGIVVFGAFELFLITRLVRECSAAVALLLRAPLEQARAEPEPLVTALEGRVSHTRARERTRDREPALSTIESDR
jgi:hypothetical protein